MLPPRRPRGPRSSAGLLAFLLLLSACRTAGGGEASAPGPVLLSSGQPQGAPGVGVPPAVFQALQAALSAGDDERARQVVAVLRSRPLGPAELELVVSAERVLTGRALVRGLELGLASEPIADEPGRYRLWLVARSNAQADVCLRLPPCDLRRTRTSVAPGGVEGIDYESSASSGLRQLELVPTVERRVELLSYELPLGRALGVRERWRLETRSGEIECQGERYPAAGVRVEGCEQERLSPLLEPGSAGPEALARALAAEDAPRADRLLELAVRTPPAAREEALAVLAPVVEELARRSPERIEAAEPALRWLSQNRDLGPDAAGWARYLAARSAAAEARTTEPVDGLDLPRRPRAGEGR